MRLTLYTDGGSRGNPGPAGIGIYAVEKESGREWRYGEYIGSTTNNIAEYHALCYALDRCLERGVSEVEIYMDSELIVKQIKGIYKVKNEGLLPYYKKIKEMLSGIKKTSITHVLREKNKVADSLVNRALDERGVIEEGELFSDSEITVEDRELVYESDVSEYESKNEITRLKKAEDVLKKFRFSAFDLKEEGRRLLLTLLEKDLSLLLEYRIQILEEMEEVGFHEVVLNLREYEK